MKEDIKAIKEIYKGVVMGQDSIAFIYDKINSAGLKVEVLSEFCEYYNIGENIKDFYNKYLNKEEKKLSPFLKIMSWYGMEMKLLQDNTDSKIAEILINGTNMGIIEGRKILNHKKLNKNVKKIISGFVLMQEKNIENLKNYL